MKPQWQSLTEQMHSAYQSWQDIYRTIPTTYVFQGISISTSDLNVTFAEILGMVDLVANSEEINSLLFAIHQQNIVNVIPQIVQTVTNLSANPQSQLEQLSNYLWSIKSSLVWILPASNNEYFEKQMQNISFSGSIESIQHLINQIKSFTESGTVIFNKIVNIDENTKELSDRISVQLTSSEAEAQQLIDKIAGYEREASNAKTNADASASSALANKETLESLLVKISDGLTQQKESQNKINLLANEAELVLEGNSKAGLAASFRTRRKSLETSQYIWTGAFALGILILISIVLSTSTGYLSLPKFIDDNGQVNTWAVIARILIAGPGVWFTWFAAKQYGFTLRLIEDYAFKEASALAFVGYKREMGEDEEMLKLLRETAIKNFGASPTRMLSKSDPSSPVHELVDKALENQGVFEKLIQLFKALKPEKN